MQNQEMLSKTMETNRSAIEGELEEYRSLWRCRHVLTESDDGGADLSVKDQEV